MARMATGATWGCRRWAHLPLVGEMSGRTEGGAVPPSSPFPSPLGGCAERARNLYEGRSASQSCHSATDATLDIRAPFASSLIPANLEAVDFRAEHDGLLTIRLKRTITAAALSRPWKDSRTSAGWKRRFLRRQVCRTGSLGRQDSPCRKAWRAGPQSRPLPRRR